MAQHKKARSSLKTISALRWNSLGSLIADVAWPVKEAIELFGNHSDWRDRSGGYFCLADRSTGLPIAITLIGTVPVEKAGRYLSFCQEKARRLAAHPEHRTSFESRDPDADQWGGAVNHGVLTYSFSGLPELGDEMAMMGVIQLVQGVQQRAWLDRIAKEHEIADDWKRLSVNLAREPEA